MKVNFSTISVVLLSALVLVASMGFTLNKHFCGGELQKISLNKEAENCPMCKEIAKLPACHKKALEKEKDGCCENTTDQVETSDFSLSKTVEKQSIQDFQFIAFTYVLLADIHTLDQNSELLNKEYSPPLIEHNIPVEVQSFLL